MLNEKTIVLGVSGGIAAYKAVEMIRLLTQQGADVHVIMTQNATEFIAPLTLQTLSQNPVHLHPFRLIEQSEIGHISLADRPDLVLVCPATANVMGKVACGIADDLLTTTLMTTRAPVLFAPAMNTQMWESPAMMANMEKLHQFGYHIVEPGSGDLACGTSGKGRLAELEDILFSVLDCLMPKPLAHKRIVVTAGPTREPMDPVRYLSNRSSGKMGFALARAARLWGANVTLIAGPTAMPPLSHVETFIRVETADQMLTATDQAFENADALIMCAAVADFKPKINRDEKTAKGQMEASLPLAPNADILKTLGAKKGARLMIGFAAQTHELLEKAREKLQAKNLDFIVANDVSQTDIGFDSDENQAVILGADGSKQALDKMDKQKLAFEILSHVFNIE